MPVYTLLTYFLCPPLIRLAGAVGAMDLPDGVRKLQKVPVARFGGLAVFIALLPSLASVLDNSLQICALALLLAFAALDDLYSLPPIIKLSAQTTSAAMLVCSLDFLHGVAFFGLKSAFLGTATAFLIGILLSVVLINGFNLIDGVDGLCVGAGAIGFLGAAILLSSPLALSAVFALLGFLPYNLRGKMYLGEIGTSLFGYLAAFLILDAPTSSSLPRAELLFLFFLPVFEAVSSFVRRALSGKNPLRADRRHLHHLLLSLGISKYSVNVILMLLCAVCALALLGFL